MKSFILTCLRATARAVVPRHYRFIKHFLKLDCQKLLPKKKKRIVTYFTFFS